MIKALLLTVAVLFSGTSLADDRAPKRKVITLSADNTLRLFGEVSHRTTGEIIRKAYQLHQILPKGKPMYLVLDTPGGSVVAGIQMIATLKALGRPIHTITIFAASMGFHTVQNLGTRYILPAGVLMSHLASGGIQGSIPGSSNVRLAFWTELIKNLDEIVVERTHDKTTVEEYRAMIKDEYWSFGDMSVKDGYADEVVVAVCDGSFFERSRVQNQCPLIPPSGGMNNFYDYMLTDFELIMPNSRK